MRWIVFFTIALFLSFGSAQTLIVSDIDDTIKVAHVSNYLEAAQYALDSKTTFYGMSEVYNWLLKDLTEPIQMVYLTKAPAWFLEKTHKRFLKNGSFPEGKYIPRTQYSSADHKILNLRQVINEVKPVTVIFIGDNTEEDSDVYAKIATEFKNQKITFYTYIRNVTSKPLWHPDQVAFLTSADLAWQLHQDQLLSDRSLDLTSQQLIPSILNPRQLPSYLIPIPNFVMCGNFEFSPTSFLQHNTWFDLSLYIRQRCLVPGAIGL